MNFDQLPVLLRREFQEHRASLMITPFVITCFLTMVTLIGLLVIEFGVDARISADIQIEGDEDIVIGDMDEMPVSEAFSNFVLGFAAEPDVVKERKMTQVLLAIMQPLTLGLWVVIFFYLLGALYDDRKDRSILFWKSMPVSDAMTIASKLLTAIVVAPVIFMAAIVAVHLVFMLTLSVAVSGLPVEIWDSFWKPAGLPGKWASLVGYFLFTGLWCLPFHGWLLLVSAFARSIPILWAVGVPAGLVIVERIFTVNNVVGEWIGRHLLNMSFDEQKIFVVSDGLSRLASVDFAITILVGVAFLYGAILMRGRGDEI